eukprot:3609774-Karenia_brevis.AAC.1
MHMDGLAPAWATPKESKTKNSSGWLPVNCCELRTKNTSRRHPYSIWGTRHAYAAEAVLATCSWILCEAL